MTGFDIIAARRSEALAEIRSILEKYDAELGTHLRKASHGGGVPNATRQLLESNAYLAECLLALSRVVDEQVTPKKRGRPRSQPAE